MNISLIYKISFAIIAILFVAVFAAVTGKKPEVEFVEAVFVDEPHQIASTEDVQKEVQIYNDDDEIGEPVQKALVIQQEETKEPIYVEIVVDPPTPSQPIQKPIFIEPIPIDKNLASVKVNESGGTIISREGLLLTSARVFSTDEVNITYSNGSKATAKLVAIDRERDLAVGRVDPNTILGIVLVGVEKQDLMEVGYEGIVRNMTFKGVYKHERTNRTRWALEGDFAEKDCGAGLFSGDHLVGVISQKTKNGVFATTEVIDFLKENDVD